MDWQPKHHHRKKIKLDRDEMDDSTYQIIDLSLRCIGLRLERKNPISIAEQKEIQIYTSIQPMLDPTGRKQENRAE